ncbi:MAG: hypothetical protein AAGH74_01675 [Pseudomonadota bacterium]
MNVTAKVVKTAFIEAINAVGYDVFKSSSFFIRNEVAKVSDAERDAA